MNILMGIYFKWSGNAWFITISFWLSLERQKITKHSKKIRQKHSRLKETPPDPHLTPPQHKLTKDLQYPAGMPSREEAEDAGARGRGVCVCHARRLMALWSCG